MRLSIASLLIVASTIANAAPRKTKPRSKARPSANAVADSRAPKPQPKPQPKQPKEDVTVVDHAKIWKTSVEVALRKQPGERQAVVGKLAAGTQIEIVREEGRWLLVRAGKLVGYLTRTTVVDATPLPPLPPTPVASLAEVPTVTAPSTRRWSSDRTDVIRAGESGMFLAATATAPLLAEPRDGASKLADASRGDRLAVIDASDPAWIQVRISDGRTAWISRSAVDDGTARVALATTDPAARRVDAAIFTTGGTTPATARRLVVRLDAGVGYRSLGMDFTSNGTSGLANYVMSADAAAAGITGDVVLRLSSRLSVGVDARIQVGTSAPGSGIEYTGPSRAGGSIPFSTFAGDGGVRIGIRARRVFDLGLRAGFHYDTFLTKTVANAGRLPREHLIGAVVGARILISPPRSRISVGIWFDGLVLGSRGQTAGLEDGASSTARATWAGATIRIPIARRLSILSAYDFGRATTDWTGMSVRTPGTTAARRVDSTQTVQLGLAAEL